MIHASDEIVCIEGLVKDFRPGFGLRTKRVLHGVTFSVHEGEIFGFVGPNGAGKTTTLKVLMGLISATEGRAEILGYDVRDTGFRRHVGFLPENPYFYDYLSGREILNFYAKLCGLSASRRAERVELLLDWVGLMHAADSRLRTYSKGMLQRVGIAQALVHDPSVVFLDEPMSGLDPIGRKQVRDLILRLRADGKTVFMNTHILSDVEMICDRVAIIVDGHIRYEGELEAMRAGESHEVEVVLARLAPEAAVELEERWQVRMRGIGDRIEVLVNQKHVRAVLGAALERGADVLSVTPRRASLESLFLSTVEAQARLHEQGEAK